MIPRATIHRIARRGRIEWFDNMRFGTEVTRDSGPFVSIEDQILKQLLRGPALSNELPHGRSKVHVHVAELNKLLRCVGRKIVGTRIAVRTRLGLPAFVRRYELVRVA